MNIISYLESKKIDYKLTSGNQEATFPCPVCGEKGKFYVNTENGAFICFRGSCDTKGGWKDLVKLLGDSEGSINIDAQEEPRDIQDPEPIPSEIIEEYHQSLLNSYTSFEKYLTEKRGYTIETIKKFKLGWGNRCLLIPIYDEKGNCVNFIQKPDPTRPNPSKSMFSITGRGRMRLFNIQVLLGEVKPDEVIICEGMWDCMKLTQEGYIAVSSTTGAGSFKAEWLPLFEGVKKIYICQDNDTNSAGQKGSLKIAKMFQDQKIETYLVNLPNPKLGIEEKIDITDFFVKLGKSKEHFDLLLQTAQPLALAENEKKYRLADYLCEIAIGAGVKVFLNNEDPYIVLPNEPLVAYPLVGGKFRGWLKARYWDLKERGFNGEAFKEVVDTLSAKAYHNGTEIRLWNRVAMVENTIYYDMGDGRRVVKIDKEDWEVTTKAPVVFRRFSQQLPQIDPDREGNLAEVTKFVNLKNNKDRLLYLTYLVTGLNPTIPRALLTIYGDQGSAKSTALRITRCIIDPSNAGSNHPSRAGNLLSPPKDDTDLAGKSSHHYCLYFDNLSYCPDWMSDAFARLITGASFTKRKLYTDSDEVTFSEMPLVGISGITLVAEKPDLLDRLLILEMERISPDKRKTEKEFWKDFELALPKILGGLFTTLSKTLGLIDTLDLGNLPRMADYANFATAVAIALGSNKEDFLLAFNQNIERQNQSVVDSSPVAQTIILFMEDKNEEWEGSSSQLYSELSERAVTLKLSVGGRDGFPKDPKWLWRKIQVVRSNLADLGIQVHREVRKEASFIKIFRRSNDSGNDTTHTTDTLPVSKIDGNSVEEKIGVTTPPELTMATNVTEATFPTSDDDDSRNSFEIAKEVFGVDEPTQQDLQI
mgnify:FL=1